MAEESFELEIVGELEKEEDDLLDNSLYKGARGGTELMLEGLKKRLDPELWDKFNFIMSRVRDEFIDPDKPNILWLQDLAEDPEAEHLAESESRDRFAKIVFASNWQQHQFYEKLHVPYENGIVLKNACEPFPIHDKPEEGKLRLIYFSTPHRGLNVLESALRYLDKQRKDFEVDVYSSFKIYGWPEEQDSQFQELYDRLDELDCVNYHGTVSNEEIREALVKTHILAYPSIYPETSCCVAIESMAAGLLTIVPNFGALPETCADFAWMYNWESDPSLHAQKYSGILNNALNHYRDAGIQGVLKLQATYYNYFYGWDMRILEWETMLKTVLREYELEQLEKN